MQQGQCLCGAVRFSVSKSVTEKGACHCGMCRRWSGGPWFAAQVEAKHVTFENDETLKIYTSSDWAERAFCTNCGGGVFYRVTADGPVQGDYFFNAETLKGADDFTFTHEVFIDHGTDGVAFEGGGERKRMTEADVMAMFTG